MLSRVSLVVILVAGMAATVRAQTWNRQAPMPTALELHGVHMVSNQEAWAIGDSGVLCHTTDAGRNWTTRNLGSDMEKVTFVDPLNGWAVGNSIFRTTNGGVTWTKVTGLKNSTLDNVFFLDTMTGWATEWAGIWRTTDGGVTWRYFPRTANGGAGGIFFHDAQRGWVVTFSGIIEQTLDGGRTWTQVHKQPNTILFRIWFQDNQTGWAVGLTKVLGTTDGGMTWNVLPFPANERAASACFVPPAFPGADPVCITAGVGGSMVRSDDGWQTYQVIRTQDVSEPALNDVHFFDQNTGFAVGEYGRLLYTWDGGQSWVDRQSGGQGVIHKLDANDVAHAWAAADKGRVIRTSDGGNRWEQVVVDGFSQYGWINDVDFFKDDLTGWAVGVEAQFTGDASRISRSTDGGRTWTLQYTTPTDFYLETIGAVNKLTAVAMGVHPYLGELWVHTTDGGQTWQDVTPSGTVGAIDCSDFVNQNVGYAAGGRMWKTRDGGATWKQQQLPGDYIEGISFADTKNGWAVGGYGYIIHTADGGKTWQQQAVNQFPRYRMYDVSAVSPTEAWMVAGEYFSPFRRLVAYTTDGGQTWQSESVPGVTDNTQNGLRAVSFVDPDNGWIGSFVPTTGLDVEGGLWRRTGPTTRQPVLAHDRLLMGAATQLRITGATPGDMAGFFVSATGVAGVKDFRLLPPAYFLTARPVDGSGSVILNATVPSGLPPFEIHLQSLIATSASGLVGTNTTSAWIER